MGHRKKFLALACAGVLATGMGIGISQAQDAPPPPPGIGGPGPGPGGPGFRERFEFRGDRGDRGHRGDRGFRGGRFEPAKHIEGRVAFLKAELKITDAQTRAWDQYATFMRDTAKARQAQFDERKAEMEKRRAEMQAQRPAPGERREPPKIERKPLLERLNNQETRAKEMLQAVEKRKAATQALYKVLNDEQKKLAEELL